MAGEFHWNASAAWVPEAAADSGDHVYSPKLCPHCGKQRLTRIHRPIHLRLLRHIGVDRRAYRCQACGKRSTLHHRGR